MRILIIGLGLIGGSLALSLKILGHEIIGCDIGENANTAKKLALANSFVDSYNENLKPDIIILATPIKATESWLQNLSSIDKHITVIDLCSTKQGVIEAAKNIRNNFVAAHPMCGTEYSGPNAAIHNLYTDKTVVLCELENSGKEHVKKALDLFTELKMNIVEMSAKQHDKHAAFISHLPHILSFSLANAVMSQESPENILAMAAGGFKDMSRLAKSSPYTWEQIFLTNKDEVLKTLEIFEEKLLTLKNAIKSDDSSALINEMSEANRLHQLFGNIKWIN